MLDEIIDRLKSRSLQEGDYAVLADALREGKIVASGVGAMAIGGDVKNSSLTTIVLQVDGADPIKVSEEIIPKINEAVRQSLPSVLNNLPEVAADFTGRVEEENTIAAALSREGGALTISALKGIGGIGKTALAVKIAAAPGIVLSAERKNLIAQFDRRDRNIGFEEPVGQFRNNFRATFPDEPEEKIGV
jgi:hypothetical protein